MPAGTMTIEQFNGWVTTWPQRIESGDHSRLLKDMRHPIYAAISANFTSSSASDGTPWTPRQNPKAKGRSKYAGHPLLIDTGDLYLSATSSQGANHIEIITGNEMTLGTSVAYAAYHEYGTSKMEARPFFSIDEAAVDELADMALEYFENLLFGHLMN